MNMNIKEFLVMNRIAFETWSDDILTSDLKDPGELSDGYHTFNSLYQQRLILFAALCNTFKDSSWKSHKHHDGEECFDGGWFIVGIETPEGSYTYHYENKDWNLFKCKELPTAPLWDGHTEKDVKRLLSLDKAIPSIKDTINSESEESKIR